MVARHEVPGAHYARTAEAWLANLEAHAGQVEALFRRDLGAQEARLQLERWRICFIACAELFAYRRGSEWLVTHQLLAPRKTQAS